MPLDAGEGQDEVLPAELFDPQIRLIGDIDTTMLLSFQRQLSEVGGGPEDPVVVELTTLGGDAELSRRLALEMRLARRRMDKQVHFTGPLKAQAQVAREILAQIELGLELERDGFAELVEDADVSIDEVIERAAHNWYVTAEEALKRKLVAALV